ncbi:hypothetical protein DL93DRAFT_2067785, partial [Clavulina sp. PMI_390]
MPITCSESSRVLWICGPAGCGKTSIIRSAAALVKSYHRMGSFYGFSRAGSGGSLSALFSTIAQDLADCDNMRKIQLVEAVKDNKALRTTKNPQDQFDHMIIGPVGSSSAIGPTVIFIDAFDEAGDQSELREDVLKILSTNASKVPGGLRIVIASRQDPDV